jgi:hypothetical protein
MPKLLITLCFISISLHSVVPSTALSQRGARAPVSLPDGPGKEIVQSVCSQCHGLGMITNDGYTRAEWQRVFSTMVDLPKEQSDLVATYLATHFPEKPKPVPVMISGPASVQFKEWSLPTKDPGRTIRLRLPTARSGTPACSRTSSAE